MQFILQIPGYLNKQRYVKYKNLGTFCLSQRTLKNLASLAPGYQPKLVENDKLQSSFIETYYAAKGKCKSGTYRMLLPPPNVTGNLHLGHALMAIVQDVICRQKRQMGYDVIWIPGMDHAGIATQVVVEKKLLKERGLTRHQIGRELFLKEIWKWKQEKGEGIKYDLRKLGCTLSWDNEYFTMDQRQAFAVNEAFIRLFEEGLITRRESLVNWSCTLESAISDIEVETLDIKGPTEIAVPGYSKNITFGRIYDINYKILGSSNETITVSTTRPETLLGDVAVAVNPLDERYKKFRDLSEVLLWHPFREERIPLIFDVNVDPEIGTGAVKITPAHDRNDFELACRHLLKTKQVFTQNGKICEDYKQFSQLPRFEAREKILQKLAELELLVSIRDHNMQLPICSRSKDIIEYMLRKQWFLSCQTMANEALAEVLSGRLQIIPANFEIDWQKWLENCHDWCVSRQLWWGHQIPAYKAVDSINNNSTWVAAHSIEDAFKKAQYILQTSNLKITQDCDVLDTWFSSALLPFSVSSWPSEEYKQNYPLDLMETGHDILFFWVARMVMLGLKLTGMAPFKKILLNGLVCDVHGRKMSKSLGNVVTPQQVIKGATLQSLQEDIKASQNSGILSVKEVQKSLKGLKRMFPQGIQECGTDALRFTLCSHNIKSHFINFNVNECYTNKLFLNKIWQATRFTLGAADRLQMPLQEVESLNHVQLNKWDQWLLSRLAETLKICHESFENYNLHTATQALKQYLYNNVCDVYVETCKTNINLKKSEGYIHCATLATALSWSLQAMSPFTPFLSEELLNYLPRNVEVDLNRFQNPKLEQEINDILEVCQNVRQIKSRYNISKKYDPQLKLFAHKEEALKLLQKHELEIQALTLVRGIKLEMLNESSEDRKDLKIFSTAGHLCSFGISTNDLYKPEVKKSEVMSNINEKKLKKLEAELKRYQMRIQNKGFRKLASLKVQEKHAQKIQQLVIEIEKIKSIAS
ncbi:valyl-tRNA synthetase, mitochondrial isoform 2-T2 [Cochliomyia hominivorax]